MRVVIMRPAAEAASVAEAVEGIGHTPIVAPVMTIVPLPVVLPPETLDAVLVTSLQAAATLDAPTLVRLRSLPCYAVGGATAAAMRLRGFDDVRIGAGDGAALADLVRLTLRPGGRLLHLAGRQRKPEPTQALLSAGFDVTVVETYDARPLAHWADTVVAAAGQAGFDACLHFSRRSAMLALEGCAGTPVASAFRVARHACLSTDVAEPLRMAGYPQILVAERPTTASLLQVLQPTLGTGP